MKKISFICDEDLTETIIEYLNLLKSGVADSETIDVGDLGIFEGADFDIKSFGDLNIKNI